MMLAKFRQKYPQGSLVSELIEIERGFYLVKVSVQVEQIVLATGLAGAGTIEVAEDSARERAIAALVLDDGDPATIDTTNTATTAPNRTSSKEATVTQVSLDEPERKIVNLEHKSEAFTEADKPEDETAASIPKPIPDPILEPEIPSTPQPNLFSGTFTTQVETPSVEEPNSVAVVDSTPAIATANSKEIDFNEIQQKTDIEMKRLGWTKNDGREFLRSHYGKRSRLHLKDEQLLEFLEYLEQQPTPVR